MKVVLDTQHKYKPIPYENDRGAFYKGLHEADLVDKYFDSVPEDREKRMTMDLTQQDIVIIRNNPAQNILTGWYSNRIKWANENKVDLYFAGHLNAGRGKYGMVGIADYRYEKYADVLASFFKQELKNDDFRVIIMDSGDRGYACIAHSFCPAFLLEPAFLDNDEHFEKLLNGDWLYRIGKAILKFIFFYKETRIEKKIL